MDGYRPLTWLSGSMTHNFWMHKNSTSISYQYVALNHFTRMTPRVAVRLSVCYLLKASGVYQASA